MTFVIKSFFRELKEIEIELGIVVEYDMKLLIFA